MLNFIFLILFCSFLSFEMPFFLQNLDYHFLQLFALSWWLFCFVLHLLADLPQGYGLDESLTVTLSPEISGLQPCLQREQSPRTSCDRITLTVLTVR